MKYLFKWTIILIFIFLNLHQFFGRDIKMIKI